MCLLFPLLHCMVNIQCNDIHDNVGIFSDFDFLLYFSEYILNVFVPLLTF